VRADHPEWTGPKEARQPHCSNWPDTALVVLAGMWKLQQRKGGTYVQAY
jgi:hypothetical protein